MLCVQASEEVSKTLVSIKNMLYGTGEQDPQTELNAQLAQEMYNNNMLQLLIENLNKIDFEVHHHDQLLRCQSEALLAMDCL